MFIFYSKIIDDQYKYWAGIKFYKEENTSDACSTDIHFYAKHLHISRIIYFFSSESEDF